MLDVKKCVKNCMEKYGLSREDATRIATTDSEMLTVEDLRYKYDDDRIGNGYPDWVTPEEHLQMCYAIARSKYNSGFTWYNSCDDVAHDLFLYSSIHLHKYSSKFQLRGLIICRLKNLIRDYTHAFNVTSTYCDFEDVYTEDDTSAKSLLSMGAYVKDDVDVVELVSTISSIRNTKIKGILLLCGYFLADIQEFLPLLVEYYGKCTESIKNKIYDLGRDDFLFCSSINRELNRVNKADVSMGKIVWIFGYRNKDFIYTDLLPFMRNIGFTN